MSDPRSLVIKSRPPAHEVDNGPQQLPRVLGLFDATMIVVGSIIGSGIFLKVSAVDSALESYGFVAIMGIWLFVGIITLCGSLALAELAPCFHMRVARTFIFGKHLANCRRSCGVGLSSGSFERVLSEL